MRLVTLYAAFFGLALYLVVSLSDPFSGGNAIEPTTFERLLDWMQDVENYDGLAPSRISRRR